MNNIHLCIALLLVLITWTVYGQTGEEILSQARENSDADDQVAVITMTVTDSDGVMSVKKMEMRSLGDHRMIKIKEPADVRGVGFLVLDAGKSDEQMYFYSPAFRKIRQITTRSEKDEKFMGSDLSFEDLAQAGYEEDYFADITEDRDEVYILELTPKDPGESGYGRLLIWVKKNDLVFEKVEFYSLNNQLEKIMTSENYERKGNYMVPRRVEVENLIDGSATVLQFDSLDINAGLSERDFSVRYLKR